MSLLSLLLALILVLVLFWGARALLTAFHVGEPINTVIYVLLVVVVVIWILGQLGGGSLGSIRLR